MEGEAYNKLNSEKTYAYAPGTYLAQWENVILVNVQILIPPTTGENSLFTSCHSINELDMKWILRWKKKESDINYRI